MRWLRPSSADIRNLTFGKRYRDIANTRAWMRCDGIAVLVILDLMFDLPFIRFRNGISSLRRCSPLNAPFTWTLCATRSRSCFCLLKAPSKVVRVLRRNRAGASHRSAVVFSFITLYECLGSRLMACRSDLSKVVPCLTHRQVRDVVEWILLALAWSHVDKLISTKPMLL